MMIFQWLKSDTFKAVMNSHLIARPRILWLLKITCSILHLRS